YLDEKFLHFIEVATHRSEKTARPTMATPVLDESPVSHYSFYYSRPLLKSSGKLNCLFSTCPGGEIGRRKGLKILFSARRVWVQTPPGAPVTEAPHPTATNIVYRRVSSIRPRLTLLRPARRARAGR